MCAMPNRALTVAVLGTTQTQSWGSSYYLPAILATPIAAEFGVSRATIFGIFSVSLLLTGEPVFTVERTTWWQGQSVTFVRLSFGRGHRMTTRY